MNGGTRSVRRTRVRFNHTHIELKVDVNIPDIPVQMAVDKVRLYPNPAHNSIHNQKVQIFEDGSKRLLGEALSRRGRRSRHQLHSLGPFRHRGQL